MSWQWFEAQLISLKKFHAVEDSLERFACHVLYLPEMAAFSDRGRRWGVKFVPATAGDFSFCYFLSVFVDVRAHRTVYLDGRNVGKLREDYKICTKVFGRMFKGEKKTVISTLYEILKIRAIEQF